MRQSIVAGCRPSQTRIIRSSSIRAEWHASLTRIFLILSRGGNQTGYQTDQSSSRKIQRKEFPPLPRRVLLLLLFERIFSRMIHCPRGERSFLLLQTTSQPLISPIDPDEPPPILPLRGKKFLVEASKRRVYRSSLSQISSLLFVKRMKFTISYLLKSGGKFSNWRKKKLSVHTREIN